MTSEPRLVELATQLRDQYLELTRIFEGLREDQQQNLDVISVQMAEIKRTEEQLKPLREEYVRDGKTLSPQLKTINDETIVLVKQLMPKLNDLEKASIHSLRRLFPKIQGSVRAVQMQNAYQGNSVSASR
jgi:hypothetical protein